MVPIQFLFPDGHPQGDSSWRFKLFSAEYFMKRSAILRALIPLVLLASCIPLPPLVTSTPSPGGEGDTATGTPGAPVDIPLPAGYGVRGAWYELYFTNPSSPLASQRTGGVDGPLVAALDAARLSIDAAMYSFSLDSVRAALIRAHQRGVRVRVVMESDSMDRADPQAIIEAGIPVLGDRREGLMHNKFMVIDGSEVWTGSMNFTDSGTYQDNNNIIRIRSIKVAEDYTTEFNEMFVDDKFGPDDGSPTPNPRVTIDGTPLDIYFSPDDNVANNLLDLLNNANESIYFLAYSFTSDPLAEAIRARAEEGITVEGVMDDGQIDSNIGTEFDPFRQAGLDIRRDGNEAGLLHHKVIIIDEQTVIMGSYNFTNSAETRNDENLIVIYDAFIAAQYLAEFQRDFAIATK
jgi:phosphatidylserine/phosphatidylglycerophosphate/cardiolipin synthase-like enzyme